MKRREVVKMTDIEKIKKEILKIIAASSLGSAIGYTLASPNGLGIILILFSLYFWLKEHFSDLE